LDKQSKKLIFVKHLINIQILLLVLLLAACSKSEAPQLSLTEEKMLDILVDVHIAESSIQNIYGSEKDSLINLYYQQIYKIHDITEATFNENMKLIRRNPPYVEKLYKIIVDRLSDLEKEKKKEEESKGK